MTARVVQTHESPKRLARRTLPRAEWVMLMCVGVVSAAPTVDMYMTLYKIRGVPRWRDRFPQYGIKVRLWGSGTLKIVIPVENHPQKPENRLIITFRWVGGVNQRKNRCPYHICKYRGGKGGFGENTPFNLS